MAGSRDTLVDVQRVEWMDRFFATWRFDAVDDLLAAVATSSVDPARLEKGYDLKKGAMWGWGYWFLFLKGWLEYREARAVECNNTYVRYMTTVLDAEQHVPGIVDVLQDAKQARSRIGLRFSDMDKMSELDPYDVPPREVIGEIRVWLHHPYPPEAKRVFEAGTGHSIGPGMIDGHHRLFGARLYGLRALPARVFVQDPAAAVLDLAGRIGELLRFTVPRTATVAVVDEGGVAPTVHASRRARFPPPGVGDVPADHLINHLEHGRQADGWQYLLIPAPAIPWLEERAALRDHLDEHYRVAVQDSDHCILYVLWEDPGTAAEDAGPPVEMRMLSTGIESERNFDESGAASLRWISEVVRGQGEDLGNASRILDFGCGAGRLLRHLRGHPGHLIGVDINPYLIAWVQANLPSLEAKVNASSPPLEFDAASFDVVLAIDVFSHLDRASHCQWIEELERVTKPGGFVVLTVHGSKRASALVPELRERFDAGRLAVRHPELTGTIDCAAYQPEAFVRTVLASRMELLVHLPAGATDVDQDAVLLRRSAYK